MILAQKKSFLEGLNALGTEWVVAVMSGAVPTQASEIPFDPTDPVAVYQNAQAIFEAGSFIRNDNHLKFTYTNIVVPYIGVGEEHVTGKGYLVYPESIQTSMPNTSITENLLIVNRDAEATNVSSSGDTHIFDLGRMLNIKSVSFKTSGGLSGTVPIDYFDGTEWKAFGYLNGSEHNFEPQNPVAASKFRISTVVSKGYRLEDFKIYASERPVDHKPAETLTWAMLLPKNAESKKSLYGNDYPFLFMDVSGPNGGGTMVLNRDNPKFGEDVKLLYLTLQPAVAEF